jgi:hypothetical protein
METNIALRRDIPPPTPQIAKSLSPQERIAHRETIASEVKTVLSAYFQPHEDERIKAAQLAWWCDELEDWTQEQVVWGLRKWNRDNPRLRPTPGDIVAILKLARGKKVAAQMKAQEPQRPPQDRHTEAEMAEMRARMADAGNSVLQEMRSKMGR